MTAITSPQTPYPADPELDLVLERELGVTPEQVWQAWTTPALLQQFFAPRPWSITKVELDVFPGGKFFSVMASPEGQEFENLGCFLEVVPHQRLVWTSALGPGYRPLPSEMPFTAVLELAGNPSGGTNYRAVAVHQSPEDRKTHQEMGFQEGWGTVIDQLENLIQTAS